MNSDFSSSCFFNEETGLWGSLRVGEEQRHSTEQQSTEARWHQGIPVRVGRVKMSQNVCSAGGSQHWRWPQSDCEGVFPTKALLPNPPGLASGKLGRSPAFLLSLPRCNSHAGRKSECDLGGTHKIRSLLEKVKGTLGAPAPFIPLIWGFPRDLEILMD